MVNVPRINHALGSPPTGGHVPASHRRRRCPRSNPRLTTQQCPGDIYLGPLDGAGWCWLVGAGWVGWVGFLVGWLGWLFGLVGWVGLVDIGDDDGAGVLLFIDL